MIAVVPLFTITTAATSLLILWRRLRGQIVLSCAPYCILFLILMFGIYPLYRIVGGHGPANPMVGRLPADFDGAVLLGAMGTVAFCAGVLIPRARVPRRHSRGKGTIRLIPLSPSQLSFICLLLGLMSVSLFAERVGGLGSLFRGRRADDVFAGLPGVLVMAPLTQAAVMTVVFARQIKLKGPAKFIVYLSWFISIILLSPLGNRRFLLPALACPILALLIARGKDVKYLKAIPVLVIGGLVLLIIPEVRAEGARSNGVSEAINRAVTDDGGVLFKLATAQNFEMVDGLAMQLKTASRTNQPPSLGLDTIKDFIFAIFPSSQVGIGTESTHDKILKASMDDGCSRNTGCPDVSFLGSFYWELGSIGAILGSFGFGLFIRRYSGRISHRERPLEISYRAVAIVFAPITIRAVITPTGTFWLSMIILVLLANSTMESHSRFKPIQLSGLAATNRLKTRAESELLAR